VSNQLDRTGNGSPRTSKVRCRGEKVHLFDALDLSELFYHHVQTGAVAFDNEDLKTVLIVKMGVQHGLGLDIFMLDAFDAALGLELVRNDHDGGDVGAGLFGHLPFVY